MKKDSKLYWIYSKIWIFGIAASFPITSIFAYTLREISSDLIVPFSVGILFSPLIVMSIYGLKNGYFPSHRIGYITTGLHSRNMNLFLIVLYVGVLCLVLFNDFK